MNFYFLNLKLKVKEWPFEPVDQEECMPLVHISILEGQSPERIRAIADGVHRALVAVFDTPADDRFQMIRQLRPGELIYDSDYLGVHRSEGVVFVHIFASRTRSTAAKQALYRAIADNLSASPGVRPEDVVIVLSPNDRDDWSFGNGLASYVHEPFTTAGANE